MSPIQKTILLARPHPFIVGEMRPFLASAGYATDPLEQLADLQRLSRRCDGAVISLAVASPLSATAEEVFSTWHRCAPEKPVAFASLAPLNQMMPAIERATRCTGVQPMITCLQHLGADGRTNAPPTRYLYVSKSDLASADRRELALGLVRRHFS